MKFNSLLTVEEHRFAQSLRAMFQAYQEWHAVYEDHGLETIWVDGVEWSIFDMDAIWASVQQHLAPGRVRAIKRLVIEGLPTWVMGVPADWEAYIGRAFEMVVEMLRQGLCPSYRLPKFDCRAEHVGRCRNGHPKLPENRTTRTHRGRLDDVCTVCERMDGARQDVKRGVGRKTAFDVTATRANAQQTMSLMKEMCAKGHALVGDNLSIVTSKKTGGRWFRCKECERQRQRALNRRRRQLVADATTPGTMRADEPGRQPEPEPEPMRATTP